MTNVAQIGILILLSLSLLLHFSILLKIVPYHFVWGGRLKTDREMYRFEMVSILINALFVVVILVQSKFIEIGLPQKIVTYTLWLMTGLFVLNTLGNLVSKNKFEKRVFTPVTILLSVFSLWLALFN